MNEFNLSNEEYKVLNIEDGDILVLKRRDIGYEMATAMQDFCQNYIEQTGKKIIMLIVDDLDDIAKVDEEFMNKFGWFRRTIGPRIIIAGDKDIHA